VSPLFRRTLSETYNVDRGRDRRRLIVIFEDSSVDSSPFLASASLRTLPCAVHGNINAQKVGKLQDMLGRLNDAAMAARMIRQLDFSEDAEIAYAVGIVAGWTGHSASATTWRANRGGAHC
jgi:hypothetical protein